MLDEIHDHLVYVLRDKLCWVNVENPEMAMGAGHVLIRFERAGQRYVFRAAKHGLLQHKRTMLAYRHVGTLGVMPEKIYHDGVCVIERHAEGVPLSTQVSDLVLKRLALALSRLHEMSAQAYGPLDYASQGSFADARAYHQSRSAVDVDGSEIDLSAGQMHTLQTALKEVNHLPEELHNAPVRLGHGDLWRNNILTTPTSLTVLDWDLIGAYPIERDLAFLAGLNLSEAQAELFFAHYTHANAISHTLFRWFAKRHVLRDRELRLDLKISKLRWIDTVTLPVPRVLT